jgi:hypothetical protein
MAELAGEKARAKEEAESSTYVGCEEHLAIQVGQYGGQHEEDGVSGLVGGEAMVIWERYGVLNSGATKLS